MTNCTIQTMDRGECWGFKYLHFQEVNENEVTPSVVVLNFLCKFFVFEIWVAFTLIQTLYVYLSIGSEFQIIQIA